MRTRLALAWLLAALPAATRAQRPTPPSGVVRPSATESPRKPHTRFLQRMHRYGNWGAAAGAVTGFATGMLTTPVTQERSHFVVTHMLMGASVGNLGGLIVGLYERQSSDTLPRILSPDVLRSPFPVLASRLDGVSDYVGMGGRVGASVGVLTGALAATDESERGVLILVGGLGGFSAGMVVGAITYLVRRG